MNQAIINFNLPFSLEEKEEGIRLASLSRKDLVDAARTIAVELAHKRGRITYDDVFREMRARGMHPEVMGNAAGSVFRGDSFRFTGEWEKSSRVTNHARVNRVWELAG